jgi:hypothetical protein
MKKYIAILFCFLLINGFSENWKELYSVGGKCKILFPSEVHHVEQYIPGSDDKSLKYDLYISSLNENDLFFMIVAQYPMTIAKDKEEVSLEGFLNGILNNKAQKNLISANFETFNGYKTLDFLVKDEGRFFKGKVFIIKNKLYLIAIECNEKYYTDEIYEKFTKSFSLVK